jgi:uracil phosphoribosyltransferase
VYSAYVSVHLVDHPVAQHTLLRLRSLASTPTRFRRHAYRLSLMIALEATRDLATEPATVQGPLEVTDGIRLRGDIVIVPVLRAGLAMIEPLLELLPDARVGHIGLQRDEVTAAASQYYMKLPPLSDHTTVLLVDPMLATGGSALAALELLRRAGARDIRLLVVVAAPEGIAAVQADWPAIDIYTAAIDRELNAHKFILPGLGDFGDRLYGT